MSCPRAQLFDLASGRIDLNEAASVQAHVATCPACAGALSAAREMTHAAEAWPAAVDDGMDARLWQALAPVVDVQSASARKRAAWRTILGRPLLHLVERLVAANDPWHVWSTRAVFAAAAVLVTLLVTGQEPSTSQPVVPPDVPDSPAVPVASAVEPVASVSPPRPLQPTTASVQSAPNPLAPVAEDAPRHGSPDALTVANTPPQPSLAPRHVRGWSHETVPTSPAAPLGAALLACGAVVDLEQAQATLVENVANGADIALDSGRVVVRVPKLPVGGRLQVRTEDVAVRVKGTAFAVDKRAKDATTVQVFEGVVEVELLGVGGLALGRDAAGREAAGRETVLLHAGETRRFESADALLRRLIVQMDEHVAAGRLDQAREAAQRYLRVAGPDGPDVDDVQLRLGGILARTGARLEAARLYRSVADGDGPIYARQNALAVLAVLHRDNDADDAERATWAEFLVRFPDGLFVREALLRLVELDCGRTDAAAERARRQLSLRFGQEPAAAAALERCRPRDR